MPRNGSGSYTRAAGTPYVYNTVIDQDVVNGEMDDIATALTNSLAKNGETTPTADLPMGTWKHTGVGAATARTHYARAAEVQDGTLTHLTSAAGTDTITASAALSMTAYAVGQEFEFIPANTNTGAATLNINSIGAGAVQLNGAALTGGEIRQNVPVKVKVTAATPVFEIIGNGAFLPSITGATKAGIQAQTYTAFTTGGTSTAYTLTPTPALTALATSQRFRVAFHTAAGTTPTLAVSGLTAKNLKYKDSTGAKQAVTSTQIPSGWVADVEYDGTDWVVLDVPPTSAAGGKVQDFRLTLTSGTPVTTANVTGATTIYCTPHIGNQIALYDGSAWNVRTSAEFSLALGTLTSGKPYDVFCYDNSGTPTLEFLVWTDDTNRATALTRQDGVFVKSGDATRRYLGTFYTTSTTQTEDSASKRYLWNYYHRVEKELLRIEGTDTWNYTTASYQQANASALNQVSVLAGVNEDAVSVKVQCAVRNTSAGVGVQVAIGLDSTTAFHANCLVGAQVSQVANIEVLVVSSLDAFVGLGQHDLVWLERSAASGTTTWVGDNGAPTARQSGISGVWRC